MKRSLIAIAHPSLRSGLTRTFGIFGKPRLGPMTMGLTGQS